MKYLMVQDQIFGYEESQSDLYNIAISNGARAISEIEVHEVMTPSPESQNESQKSLRRTAYTKESDPLFIEWQFDNTNEKEVIWREKVKEIKARFPLSVNNE